MSSLRFMQSYLTDRYQEVKGNNSYSLWSLIKYGVPHGSILGRILFNIFLYHMFFLVDSVDIASYADDNSYADAKWFPENGMNSNQDKRHFHSVSRKLTPGKLPSGQFSSIKFPTGEFLPLLPENFHPKNSHPEYFHPFF